MSNVQSLCIKVNMILRQFLAGLVFFITQVQLLESLATTKMSESPRKKQKLEQNAAAADENSKNLGPWAERWNNKRIGFHLTDVNPILKNYAEQLLTSKNGDSENGNADADQSTCSNTRVFVPLCGKTVDMAYLVTMSAEVVGVEGIRAALEQFANEQPDLKVEDKGCQDKFDRFEGNKISLLRGDYYDLDSTKTNGKFGAIYDRASMVAIQPDLRKSYVEVLGKLIAPRGKILLIALERKSKSEEAIKKGPPFSIPEDTVRDIYEGLDWVESVDLLEQSDQLEKKPEDKERYPDLDQLLEVVYMIRAK